MVRLWIEHELSSHRVRRSRSLLTKLLSQQHLSLLELQQPKSRPSSSPAIYKKSHRKVLDTVLSALTNTR